MKKRMHYVITAIILFVLCGCTNKSENFTSPVQFFYPCDTIGFFSSDAVIGSEVRETSDTHGNALLIINNYLVGPESDQLVSPFPEGTTAKTVEREGNTFIVTLNDRFSQLSGLDLSIACACLTKTVSNLTLCGYVEIQTMNTQGEITPIITLSPEDIYTFDSVLQNTPNN